MLTAKTKLREELTRKFLPALRSLNFKGPERIAGNGLIHEFRRSAGPVFHVLCVQFDRHRRPRFILDLSIVPS
jgi:hypothetical protein